MKRFLFAAILTAGAFGTAQAIILPNVPGDNAKQIQKAVDGMKKEDATLKKNDFFGGIEKFFTGIEDSAKPYLEKLNSGLDLISKIGETWNTIKNLFSNFSLFGQNNIFTKIKGVIAQSKDVKATWDTLVKPIDPKKPGSGISTATAETMKGLDVESSASNLTKLLRVEMQRRQSEATVKVFTNDTKKTEFYETVTGESGYAKTLENESNNAVSTRAAVQALSAGWANFMRQHADATMMTLDRLEGQMQQQVVTNQLLSVLAENALQEARANTRDAMESVRDAVDAEKSELNGAIKIIDTLDQSMTKFASNMTDAASMFQ